MLLWPGCCCPPSGCPSVPHTLYMTDTAGTRELVLVPSVSLPGRAWSACFRFVRSNTDVHIGGVPQCQNATDSIGVVYGLECSVGPPPDNETTFILSLGYWITDCFGMYDRSAECFVAVPGDPPVLTGSTTGNPQSVQTMTPDSLTISPFAATYTIPSSGPFGATNPITGTVVVSEEAP